jgi:hypothetical protein
MLKYIRVEICIPSLTDALAKTMTAVAEPEFWAKGGAQRSLGAAVSHIPQFGDASTSPEGDLLASPNLGICDTAL